MKEEPTIQEIIDGEQARIERIASFVDAADTVLNGYNIKAKMAEIWNNRSPDLGGPNKGVDLAEQVLAYVESEVMPKITADELRRVFVGTCLNSFIEGCKQLQQMESMKQMMSTLGLGGGQEQSKEEDDNN